MFDGDTDDEDPEYGFAEVTVYETPAYRWNWIRPLVDAFQAIAEFLSSLATHVAAHINYSIEQREFADHVRGELEKIPTSSE